jgi:hypothetical protein
MKIASPRLPIDHPDFGLECARRLQDAYDALVRLAREAGWPEREVAIALDTIALAYIQVISDNEHAAAAVARVKVELGRLN